MKFGDHDRAAGETAEQLADDDAVVLHAIQAIGNTFPAPIDGSGFSRMVTPPITAAEAARRGGATDRRKVSPCANEDSRPEAELSFRSPPAVSAASGVQQ
jgi:hypothetical protein